MTGFNPFLMLVFVRNRGLDVGGKGEQRGYALIVNIGKESCFINVVVLKDVVI